MPQSSLPDRTYYIDGEIISVESQCTYRCVVLPDQSRTACPMRMASLNAPTGAWCSLTYPKGTLMPEIIESQCTYRCVVLPDTNREELQ